MYLPDIHRITLSEITCILSCILPFLHLKNKEFNLRINAKLCTHPPPITLPNLVTIQCVHIQLQNGSWIVLLAKSIIQLQGYWFTNQSIPLACWGQCSEQGRDRMHDSMGYSDLRGNFNIFHYSVQVINDYQCRFWPAMTKVTCTSNKQKTFHLLVRTKDVIIQEYVHRHHL